MTILPNEEENKENYVVKNPLTLWKDSHTCKKYVRKTYEPKNTKKYMPKDIIMNPMEIICFLLMKTPSGVEHILELVMSSFVG